jgi:hypothetical protein
MNRILGSNLHTGYFARPTVLGFPAKPLMEHFEGDIDAKFNQLEEAGKRIIFLKEKG